MAEPGEEHPDELRPDSPTLMAGQHLQPRYERGQHPVADRVHEADDPISVGCDDHPVAAVQDGEQLSGRRRCRPADEEPGELLRAQAADVVGEGDHLSMVCHAAQPRARVG